MTPDERAELIAMYVAGPEVIRQALAGITTDEWDAKEAPGEWSPRQVIHHLADSETTSAIRIRRILVEDDPLIQNYDQDEFARLLHYDRDPAISLALFAAVRASTAEILYRMSDADWLRRGTHSEAGAYSAEDWLRSYGVHAGDHADQIGRARTAARG